MTEPPLDILLEDGPVLAVNKPAGLLTQGVPAGIPTLEAQVKVYLKEKYQKPGNVYLGIPHRLDRPASGVVLFARNSKAAARLAEQFRERQVKKVYWAVVKGTPQPDSGELKDWLRKVPDEARAELVSSETPDAKECVLTYHIIRQIELGQGRGVGALLQIELGTGRMHQIRVQLASRGCPIVGDILYGATQPLLDYPLDDPRTMPIALHARELTFLHPVRYEPVTVTAPVPANWSQLAISEHHS